MGEGFTRSMIEKTMLLSGNNDRLYNLIEKAKRKEKVKISFFGASITKWCNGDRDKCYAKQVYKQLFDRIYGDQSVLPCENNKYMEYDNKGINGTTSVYGMLRLERDVLRINPDLVIIDFAVNDWKDQLHKEAFECILRDLLECEKQPAIIILANVMENGYTCQAHMKELAEFYQIPIVGISESIMPEIKAGNIKYSDYFLDYAHPNETGHKFIADSLIYCIETELHRERDEQYQLREDVLYGKLFQHIKLIEAPDIHGKIQGFTQCSSEMRWDKETEFGPYLERTTFSYRDQITLKVSCKCFFIIYMECPEMEYGMTYVYLDGHQVEKLNGFNTTAWYNPVVRMIKIGDKKEHEIKIKMAPGDEKKKFIVYGIAYNEEVDD